MIQKPNWTPDISFGNLCILASILLTLVTGIVGAYVSIGDRFEVLGERVARDEQMTADLKEAVIDMRNDNRSLVEAQKLMLASLRDAIDRLKWVDERPR